MKKAILVAIVFCNRALYGQVGDPVNEFLKETTTYSYIEITSVQLTIIQNSQSIPYNGNTYSYFKPDYGSLQQGLQTLQARYDYNRKRIEKEWARLLSLELVNDTNKATLASFQSVTSSEVQAKCTGDLGNQEYADYWVEYITKAFRIESIKNEIKLLQKINSELIRIKYEDPDNFYKSKRYSELAEVLSKLKSCSTSEINNLAWKFGLI